jgi:hypothetical protein
LIIGARDLLSEGLEDLRSLGALLLVSFHQNGLDLLLYLQLQAPRYDFGKLFLFLLLGIHLSGSAQV